MAVSEQVSSHILGRESRFGNSDFDPATLTPYRATWAQQFR